MKTKNFLILQLIVIFFFSCEKKTTKDNPTTEIQTEQKNEIQTKPAVNKYLANEFYSMTHFDPSQSDAFPYPVPKGTFNIDLRKFPRVIGGPVGYMQMYSTDANYMWATTTGNISYVDISNNGWKKVASVPTPFTPVISPEKLDKELLKKYTTAKDAEDVLKNWGIDWLRLLNNCYMLVDKDNILYAVAGGSKVSAYGLIDSSDPSKGIKVVRTLDFSKTLNELAKKGAANQSTAERGVPIIGFGMTYDGYLTLLTSMSISIIDREFKNAPITITFDASEHVSNSMCIDENNGIYIASDKLMHKIVWTGSKLSTAEADGAWTSAYDFGEEPPSVKFGTGTGSTPTLMGFGDNEDKLVVITDGSNRMNVVGFWRNEIPSDAKQQAGTKSPRIAGQIAITCGLSPLPKFIQSEQSVVVHQYGAFVVNNMRTEGYKKDRIVDVLAGGPVYAPPVGCERVEWNPKENKWHSVWTRNDVVGTSMVPAMSSASNVAFVNGYTTKDGWELTGMDWGTGKTVTRIIFGQDNLGNGAYALIQFMPNSDLLFNSIGGPVRVKLPK